MRVIPRERLGVHTMSMYGALSGALDVFCVANFKS